MYDLPSSNLGPQLIDEATRTVEQLIEELETALDHDQCRTLHRLRLACESLGMLRAVSQALTLVPAPRPTWSGGR